MEGVLVTITLLALLTTVAMAAVAWTLMQEERRRSDARVASLSAELDTADGGVVDGAARVAGDRWLRHQPEVDADPLEAFPSQFNTPPAHVEPGASQSLPNALFSTASRQDHDATERLFPALATGAVLMCVGLAAVLLLSSIPAASAPSSSSNSGASSAHAQSLELMSVESSATPGRIQLTGVVRNPLGATQLSRVTAVAHFFGRDGGFLGSSRSTIGMPLDPGRDASFTVVSDMVGDVARYRVSFRADDDAPLSHVDRRGGR
jgi:hypothetical protein